MVEIHQQIQTKIEPPRQEVPRVEYPSKIYFDPQGADFSENHFQPLRSVDKSLNESQPGVELVCYSEKIIGDIRDIAPGIPSQDEAFYHNMGAHQHHIQHQPQYLPQQPQF
jgi:hypothetical protein